ncbi:CAF17-like 4Fe-4S cluster assembly/insertion protein YgfZ [Edaphobacter bradus]|uniref:CAF17-like 4Fe-4S cluster assembly/insertion protein YgfZ n=1 Tax=Edaphobacter bradus TaxID=2259016 RepID=UPI0021E0B19B|nr:folate-binding protein [Edaphobacter bradus]
MTPAPHPTVDNLSSAHSSPQLSALLHGAGILRLDGTGWIRVTGEDRVRWLNGMATNSIQQLAPGTGAYNFFLNAQGRIQGDACIFGRPGALLIETQSSQVATLIPFLDHYIIMDDVELKDITGTWHGLSITGPQAASLLARAGLPVSELKPLEIREILWNAATITILHAHSPLVPRYELWADATTIDALSNSLQTAGAVPADKQSQQWLRILEGTPLYGADIHDRELPQETGQARALHFAKGCYLGQEIVERIRSRGNVHRTFQAFRLEGDLPPTGTILEAAGKPAGELTSIAAIPLDGHNIQLALGYARREALDRNEPLTYAGGTAIPVAAPFQPAEANATHPAPTPSERK